MADSEPFTFVNPSSGGHRFYDDYHDFQSGKLKDLDLQIVTALRRQFPEMIVTTVPTFNCSLLEFAAEGYASAEMDTTTDWVASWRVYLSAQRRGGSGGMADIVTFAKYHYNWSGEDFIVYIAVVGLHKAQYILKEPRNGETTMTHSGPTDALLFAIGSMRDKAREKTILVYDGYWNYSRELWEHVQNASWDKVILDSDLKRELTDVSEKFFDSKSLPGHRAQEKSNGRILADDAPQHDWIRRG